MAEAGAERRLAAIVAVDVAGYSRLMGADEQGTLAAMTAHRDATAPLVKAHAGRLVGQAGDGLLYEFPSVVEAVTCSMGVQAAMAERNQDIPDDKKMLYRIGINLGDVLVEGDDIFGDGVNVASRIEALAEPGGICISRTVRDNVRDRMDIALEDLGEVEVKNIARSVRVFRVLAEGDTSPEAKPAWSPWLKYAAAAIVIVAIVAGGVAGWWYLQPDFEPADQAKFAFTLPDKPSVAVLPFDNLTGDKEQDYLGDGLTENIIAMLATLPDIFVIARNSSFTFKGRAVKVQEVAEQLGVRYVLEGSVQRSDEKLRVTAQLIDAIDGKHLWAERYDRKLEDIFSIQDDIAEQILVALQVKLTMGEEATIYRKSVADIETYKLLARANWLLHNPNPDNHRRAEKLVNEALDREPESEGANTFMAALYRQKVVLGLSKKPKEDFAQARRFAEKVLLIAPDSGDAFHIFAVVDMFAKKCSSAIANADRAVELGPTRALYLGAAGWVNGWCGKPRKAVALNKRAMRLDPFHASWIRQNLSHAHVMLGENEEAKARSKANLKSPVESHFTRRWPLAELAAIAVFEGDIALARRYVKRLLEYEPDFNMAKIKHIQDVFKDQAFIVRYRAALIEAGIPVNPPATKSKIPSIAVLPFRNLSNDRQYDALVDGLALEISDRLSKTKLMRVVGRSSMSRYKKGNIDPVEIRKTMKDPVEYLISASVQTTSKQVRIFAELLSTKDGRQVWSRKYEGELPFANPFEFQEQVALGIATAVAGGYGIIAQLDRKNIDPTSDRPLSEYECTVLTFLMFEKGITAKPHLNARNCWERIVDGDPNHADALGWLAMIYRYELSNRLNPRPNSLDRAFAAAKKAVAIDPNSQIANLGLTDAYFGQKRKDEFVAAAKKTISLDPDNLPVIGLVAFLFDHYQLFDLSVPLLERVTGVDPFAPFGTFLPLYEDAHKNGNYKKALELSLAHDPPGFIWTHIRRAMYYAQLGDKDKASENVTEIFKQQPDFGNRIVGQLRSWGSDEDLLKRYVRDLRKAGVDIPNDGS